MKYLKEILTQDNRMTSHPMFVVFKDSRIYGIDSAFDDAGNYIWIDRNDGEHEADEEEEEILEKLDEEWGKETVIDGVEFEKIYYTTRPEFVTICFTEKAAQDYINNTKHRHSEKLYIYVESMYNNSEMIGVIDRIRNEAQLKYGEITA